MTSSNEWYTVAEAAQAFNRTSAGLLYAIEHGKLNTYPIIGKSSHCLSRAELEQYAEKSAKRSAGARNRKPKQPDARPLADDVLQAIAEAVDSGMPPAQAMEAMATLHDTLRVADEPTRNADVRSVDQFSRQAPQPTPVKPVIVTGMKWVKLDQDEYVLVNAEHYDDDKVCKVSGRAAPGESVAAWKVIVFPDYTGSNYDVTYLSLALVQQHGMPALLNAILLAPVIARNTVVVDEKSGRILLD